MPKSIQKSVGLGGASATAKDVMTVQYLLNCVPANQGGPTPELAVDGIVGPKTIAAIVGFQSRLTPAPDGRVDPGGPTITCLQKYDPYPMQPMPAVPRPGRGSPAGKTGFKEALGGKAAAGKIFASGEAGYKQAMGGKAAAGKSFEAGTAAFNGWKSQLAAIDQIFDAGLEGMKDLIGGIRKHAASKAPGKPQLTPAGKALVAKYGAVMAAGAKGAGSMNAAKSAVGQGAGGMNAAKSAVGPGAGGMNAAKSAVGQGAGGMNAAKSAVGPGAGVRPGLSPKRPPGITLEGMQLAQKQAKALDQARRIQDPRERQIAIQTALAMKLPKR